MKNRIHGDWDAIHAATHLHDELFLELCRLFHAKPGAMLTALIHGQVSIDGYTIRPRHLARWTRDQLIGRYAQLCGRQAQLYGSRPAWR